jgi:tetratricopeptide (TPR) repeat protein
MTNNVVTQKLRDFTVQIRPADSEKIVGTGMIVTTDGRVVTCAHVVKSAGVEPRTVNGKELSVYFPQALGGEKKERRAKVAAFFPDFDDDVVLLQLTDGNVPLGPELMPILGTAEKSQGNAFRSYGYRGLEDYIAGWADGKIQGHVDPPPKRKVQGEPVQLESNQINRGMSGSAVLDIDRNLVVGIVSETWFPDRTGKDSDTAWAVDSRVLSLAPLGLHVQDASLDLKPAPSPKFDIAQAEAAVFIKEKYSWNSAPTILPEWTGRDDLLAQITEDWNNPQKHVTGLIGFGGEGKSSLARRWVETLNLQPATFDGLFWWGFYENRSIDEFLEAALNFLSGGKIDPRQVPSSSLRAQIIGAMLGAGRYLFVLDGLEVLQHQEGDQYGLLQSNDLRDLLTYFARPDNQSFCLITSRAPLLDLMEYTTYTHRDVERLSEADGVALLEKLGVKGSKEQTGKVVADWDGHALTISLLGSYLAEKYNGDIAHLADIPIPTADEPRYERVHRVLRRYDEHLTAAEREFLKLFSAFRTPVHESAFEKVFVPLLNKTDSTIPDSQFTDSQIANLVSRLTTYRILHCDTTSQSYTAHPLVRNHYLAILTHGDSTEQQDVHGKIKDYYLSIAGDTPQYPTLDDLKPLIEVVYHACEAGAYDDAYQIYKDRIRQGVRFVDVHVLGAYETSLSIISEFFPSGDTTQEPAVSDQGNKRWILNAIGFRLMHLGRLREAVPFYERFTSLAVESQDWNGASICYQNLADTYAQLGTLDVSAEAAHQALDFARRAEDKQNEWVSLAYQGLAADLLGDLQTASDVFVQAEECCQKIESDYRYLYSVPGICHADHLHRMDDLDYARHVTEANLQTCEKFHWVFLVSQCHRILGDLDSDIGNHEAARTHYESALKIARSISQRRVFIEALLARGRFYAKFSTKDLTGFENLSGLLDQAFTDLNEALNYAIEGGYRIYEADIRVALAWAYLANGEKGKAKESAQRALQMSQEMGYHWGKVDAEEVMNYE